MTTKLNQLLAIEKGVSGRAERSLTDAYHAMQKPSIFTGLTRTYEPKDDEGERLPGESTRVQQSVTGLVAGIRTPLTRLFDVIFEKDLTNTVARADVVIDGRVLIPYAPVTYLLWVEKRLIDLRTFVEKWPTLDPAEEWRYDTANGVYATLGAETTRTMKTPRPLVKAPATDKHPAQVDVYTVDVVVGWWRTIKHSGATEPTKRQATLDRIEALLAAVRQAREAANSIDVADVDHPGEAVLAYIFPAG